MPIKMSGAIAAVESAAIDHPLIPCNPVSLVTFNYGECFNIGAAEKAEKKYPFQYSANARINAAPMPSAAMVKIMKMISRRWL